MVELTLLLYFVFEREAIRLKRAAGEPPPWTSDEVLHIFRFCNIRRADDRVSSWLIKYVLKEEYIVYHLQSFLLFSAFARLINWPPTVHDILEKDWYPKKRIDWKRIGKFVDTRTGKTWTGAFMLPAPRRRGRKKGKFIAERVIAGSLQKLLPRLVKEFRKPRKERSCRRVWEILRECDYLGSFLAGQITADWTYTSLLSEASDLYSWAAPGPGSIRGYNRVLGITPLNKKPKEEDWLQNLQLWRKEIIAKLGSGYENLDLQSCQNSLCEYDKWARVKKQQGRPRALYHPHTYEM